MFSRKLVSFFYVLSFILPTSLLYASDHPDKRQVQSLVGASQGVVDLSAVQSQIVVKAVFFASQSMGNTRVVSNGTLTQYAPDLQSFRYESAPQDHLIVKFFNGMTLNFRVEDFRGDYSRGADSFLSGAHSLKFTAQKDNDWQLQIYSVQWNGERQAQVSGSAVYENISFNIDLKLAGSYYFESDSSGSEYRSQYRILGKIESPLYKFEINEGHDGKIVSARDTHGRSTIVSSSDRQANNQLKIGSDTYQLSGLKIRKVFRNGKPSEPEFWLSSGGNILKNSQMLATVRALYEYPYAKIKALFVGGGDLDLESWLIDTPLRGDFR